MLCEYKSVELHRARSGCHRMVVCCSCHAGRGAMQIHCKNTFILVSMPKVSITMLALCCLDPKIGPKWPSDVQCFGILMSQVR